MKICLSQITTFPKDTDTDIRTYRAAGFTAAEMALSKLGGYLKTHSAGELQLFPLVLYWLKSVLGQ